MVDLRVNVKEMYIKRIKVMEQRNNGQFRNQRIARIWVENQRDVVTEM